jgi:hypothetical protein
MPEPGLCTVDGDGDAGAGAEECVGVFRTCFNYREVRLDGKALPMRLGLASGPAAPEDIVYFTPTAPERRRARSVAAIPVAKTPDASPTITS